MAAAEQRLVAECKVITEDGTERVHVYLTGSKPKEIGTVTFESERTVMSIVPGYENWCKQIMREAKAMTTATLS